MFDWICIALCLIITLNSRNEFRVFAFITLFEFLAHKAAFILGIQLSSIFQLSRIYLIYLFIEAFTIYVLFIVQSSISSRLIIFINMVYNLLTISQYSKNIYDFYSSYKYIIGSIMIIQLIHLFGGTKIVYALVHRKQHDSFNGPIVFRRRRVVSGRVS